MFVDSEIPLYHSLVDCGCRKLTVCGTTEIGTKCGTQICVPYNQNCKSPMNMIFAFSILSCFHLILLQNEHPARGLKRPSLERVEIDSARNYLAMFISTIPIGSRVSGQIIPGYLEAQIQLSHQLTMSVIDAKCSRCVCPQAVRQPGFGVERIGEVLKERGSLDLSQRFDL